MNQERNQLKRLLRQLALLRIVLAASFIVACAATTLVLFLPFSASSGPAVPVAESYNVTATTITAATTLFSSTHSAAGQGGYTVQPEPPAHNLLGYSGFTALISWTVFGAALIWRGHVRSVWGRSRFSYDTFRLLVKMRGAQTRLKLMHALNPPKNKLQLATALGIDWKAVDKHVQVLEKNGLLHVTSTNGTATFYEVTDKGKSVIELLEQLGADVTPQD